LGAPKLCHFLGPASQSAGELVVADISIPHEALDLPAPIVGLADSESVTALLPERAPDSHKGSFGHVLVVAGSRGKAGAAVLVGTGALRSGAGLVTVATAASVRAEVAQGLHELMTEPLEETRSGRIAKAALKTILDLAGERSVVAIGPGLTIEAETAALVRSLVAELQGPTVLDADALNAFGSPESLRDTRAPLVLTPHPGEAARLMGSSAKAVQADRIGCARALAERTRAIVLLKGHATLVVSPSGDVVINPTGNPGGFLAQGLEPVHAAIAGAFVHGLAGDMAARERGEAGLIASDLLAALPSALRSLAEGDKDHEP